MGPPSARTRRALSRCSTGARFGLEAAPGRRPARTRQPASLQRSDSPRPNQNAGSLLPVVRHPMIVQGREKAVKPSGAIIVEGERFKDLVLCTVPSSGK